MTKNSFLAEITFNNVIQLICGNRLQMHNIQTPRNSILINFSCIQTILNAFTYIYNDLFKVCLNRVEQKTSRSFFV